MSILNIIKLRLGLGPAAENHFWDGSVPNQLSLKRGTPEAPGTELIKALNGVLSFPNQGQSLTANGYVKLPGGLIVQWGTTQVSPVTANTWGTGATPFSIPFPNDVLGLWVGASNNVALTSAVIEWTIARSNLTQCNISSQAPFAVPGAQCFWLAIGY